MFKHELRFLWRAVPVILLAACCPPIQPEDSVAGFKRKHPDEARHFLYLNRIAIEGYEPLNAMKSTWVNMIGEHLVEEFRDVPEVKAYGEKVLKMEADATRSWNELKQVLSNAEANGGTVCQYLWLDEANREPGILILKGGEILKRFPWYSENLKSLNAYRRKGSIPSNVEHGFNQQKE